MGVYIKKSINLVESGKLRDEKDNTRCNFMKQLSTINFQLSTSQRGFTLIELIVVVGIMSILSIIGIVNYIGFSRSQALNASVQDVALLVQQGKSYTASQVRQKTGSCTSINRPFGGYRVRITLPRTYRLEELCGSSSHIVVTKTLPENFYFTGTELHRDIAFEPLTGGIVGARVLRITGYGLTKTITVNASGHVTIQ